MLTPIDSTSAPNLSAIATNRFDVGSSFVSDDVPIALEAAVGAAEQHGGHVVPIVQQAVTHTRPEVDDRGVEQRAVAVLASP